MNFEEFKTLNDIEKEETVFDNGVFLWSDNIENTIIDMYRVNDFFVQFSYGINKTDKITITAFTEQNDPAFFNKTGMSTAD